MNRKSIEEAEKTLDSLDGMHSADPGPYFYARLVARQQAMQAPSVAVPMLWKVVVAVILVVNIFSFYLVSGTNQSMETSDPIDLLAADYFGNSTEDLSDLDYNYQLYE